MRIGHCQLACAATFEENLEKMLAGVRRAREERVQIVSFPECFLTGYPDTEPAARREAFSADSPRMQRVLWALRELSPTVVVGFNELRGQDLYNSAMVVERGRLLGIYSKCSAYQPFHRQGRAFPVFERDGVKFGVIICSDGGYIEPARILALKGAALIIAPHYNYIRPPELLHHFMRVRADHIARAVENRVWFVRANNVSLGRDPAITGHDGVGYGDSYILDPGGEIVVRSQRHVEDFIFCDIHPEAITWDRSRSLWSARELGKMMMEAAGVTGD